MVFLKNFQNEILGGCECGVRKSVRISGSLNERHLDMSI